MQNRHPTPKIHKNDPKHPLKSSNTIIRRQKRQTRISQRVKIAVGKPAEIKTARQTVKVKKTLPGLKYLWFALAAGLIVVLLNFLLRFFFAVQTVTCSVGGQQSCPTTLETCLQSLPGHSLFFTNFTKLINNLNCQNRYATAFTYHKVLPSTLKLDFTFPDAAYEINSGGESFYLTASGLPALSGELGNLVIVDSSTQSSQLRNSLLAGKIDPFLHDKLLTLVKLRALSTTTFSQVHYLDLETVTIPVANRQYIIDLLNIDEYLQKIDFLEQNWVSENNENDDDVIIDLRFKLPVIKPGT